MGRIAHTRNEREAEAKGAVEHKGAMGTCDDGL